jgi:hypothetical protein
LLAVGDSTRLEIIFNTKTSRTKVTKRPKIFIEGSDLPRSVQITSHVIASPDSTFPVVFEPYKLDISQYGSKKRTSIEFEIKNVSPKDQEIEIIDFDDRFLTVTTPKHIKAGATVKGQVNVKDAKAGDSFEKSVTLAFKQTQPSGKPVRFTIPVTRTVRTLSSTLDSVMTSTGKSGGSK